MKDVTGKELNVGDHVVTNYQTYTCELVIGTIVGFTPQKIKIETLWQGRKQDIQKFTEQVAKI